MTNQTKILSVASVAALCLSSVANAAINLDFVYNSETDTTTASYNGTWDVDSDYNSYFGFQSKQIDPWAFSSTSKEADVGHAPLGTSQEIKDSIPWGSATASSRSGDYFVFNAIDAYGPKDFTSETSIIGSLIFSGMNLAELGFDDTEIAEGGSLAFGAGTVHWSASVVPEPSTYAAIFGCIALGVVASRRRRS